jgi:hypothetical protein
MTKTPALTTALSLALALLLTEKNVRAEQVSVEEAGASPGSLLSRAPNPVAPAPQGLPQRHSFDTSPVSPIMGIYVLQYAYQFLPRHEVMLGTSYMNLPYDCGSTHAVSVFLGYRLYLWKNLHVEYQLWPTVDYFYENREKRYYGSFDLWGEARIGYRIDFDVFGAHLYVNAQWLFGNGFYASNKPQSFHEEVARESKLLGIFNFHAPMIFTGFRL